MQDDTFISPVCAVIIVNAIVLTGGQTIFPEMKLLVFVQNALLFFVKVWADNLLVLKNKNNDVVSIFLIL